MKIDFQYGYKAAGVLASRRNDTLIKSSANQIQ